MLVDFHIYQRYHRRLRSVVQPERHEVDLRPANDEDLPFLRRMLVEAVTWDPYGPGRLAQDALEDDRISRYVEGWKKAGDFGVIVEDEVTRPLGVAWCRTMPAERPGFGFVAAGIPELSIAVTRERRGQGIGTRLLGAIEEEARWRGTSAISLSVAAGNPAAGLYRRLGYVERRRDGESLIMVLAGLAGNGSGPSGEQ